MRDVELAWELAELVHNRLTAINATMSTSRSAPATPSRRLRYSYRRSSLGASHFRVNWLRGFTIGSRGTRTTLAGRTCIASCARPRLRYPTCRWVTPGAGFCHQHADTSAPINHNYAPDEPQFRGGAAEGAFGAQQSWWGHRCARRSRVKPPELACDQVALRAFSGLGVVEPLSAKWVVARCTLALYIAASASRRMWAASW
jgi:hypothetical protein